MKNIEKILWAMNNCPHKFRFEINNEGVNMAYFNEEGKYNITVSPQLYKEINPQTGEEVLSTFPIGERIQDEQMLSTFAEGVILHELFHLYRGDLLKEYDGGSDIPVETQQYLYNIASDVIINHWLNNPIINQIGVTWQKLAGKYPDLPAINEGTENIYEYLLSKYREEKEKLKEELQKLGENVDVKRELEKNEGNNNGENKEESNQKEKGNSKEENEKEGENDSGEGGNESDNNGENKKEDNRGENGKEGSNKESEKGNRNNDEREGENNNGKRGNGKENESGAEKEEKGNSKGNEGEGENGNKKSNENESNQGGSNGKNNRKENRKENSKNKSGNNISEEVKEKLDKIRVYAREVLRNSGRGNMPNPFKGEIPPIKKNKLSPELEEAVKVVNQLVKHMYRMRRDHRRIPSGDYRILKVQPQKRYFPNMHVYIDVSGSIGEKVIEILNGYNLLPPENIWVFSDRVEKMKNLNEVIYGGTLFAPIWENIQKTKPRNVVIISDFLFFDASEEEIEGKFKKEKIMLHKIKVQI